MSRNAALLVVTALASLGGGYLAGRASSPDEAPLATGTASALPDRLPGEWDFIPHRDHPPLDDPSTGLTDFETEAVTLADLSSPATNSPPLDLASSGSEEPAALPRTTAAVPIDSRTRKEADQLRELVARLLPNATPSEREVWFDVLHGLPEKEATEILEIWKLTNDTGETTPDAPLAAQLPAVPEPRDESLRERLLRESLQADAAHRDTPGWLRRDPLATVTPANTLEQCPLDLSRGPTVSTGNPLHLLIEKDGFFALEHGDQRAFTRAGLFDIDDGGTIVQHRNGTTWRLTPEITVPDDAIEIHIDNSGTVRVLTAEGSDAREIGKIGVWNCRNPQWLDITDDGLLIPGERSGPMHRIDSFHKARLLRQRAYEASNARKPGR